jgi:hypothetical protein
MLVDRERTLRRLSVADSTTFLAERKICARDLPTVDDFADLLDDEWDRRKAIELLAREYAHGRAQVYRHPLTRQWTITLPHVMQAGGKTLTLKQWVHLGYPMLVGGDAKITQPIMPILPVLPALSGVAGEPARVGEQPSPPWGTGASGRW